MVVTDYGAKLCGFEVGDQLTVEQLFYSLLIYSGNDAANALAIHIAGSIEAFADMMNEEAKKLGCVAVSYTHLRTESFRHLYGIDRNDSWKKRRVSDRILFWYPDGCSVCAVLWILCTDTFSHRLHGRLCTADFL